jgi:hypothetical protein
MLTLAGEATGDGAALAETEGELAVCGVVCALIHMGRARLAAQMPLARLIVLLMTSPNCCWIENISL